MLYITSLVLIYLLTGSLYLLTTFIQFPPPSPPPTYTNYKSVLFFSEFACFLKYYCLQHYASFWCITCWFDTSIHYKMITTKNLVNIPCHTKLLTYYWLYYPHCTFHPWHSSICNWMFVPLNFPHLFHSFPYPLPSGNQPFVLCMCESISVLLYLFICFVF